MQELRRQTDNKLIYRNNKLCMYKLVTNLTWKYEKNFIIGSDYD